MGRCQKAGLALKNVLPDREISHILSNVLETQNIIAGEADLTPSPRNSELPGQRVAATPTPKAAVK